MSDASAGVAGTWNTWGLVVNRLVATDRSTAGVGADVSSGSETDTGTGSGERFERIGDDVFDCVRDQWSVDFPELRDGNDHADPWRVVTSIE